MGTGGDGNRMVREQVWMDSKCVGIGLKSCPHADIYIAALVTVTNEILMQLKICR